MRALARFRAPEAVPLGLWALWAVMPVAILFGKVGGGLGIGSQGRLFLGADQLDVADQLQYMAWARDAGRHALFSNLFDLAPDPHLFLHPLYAVSGFAWRAGLSIQLAYLLWRPVAVAAIALGFALYVRRLVPPAPRWARPVALGLALFLFTPAPAILDWAGVGSFNLQLGSTIMAVEMFPGAYTSVGIVVGLMPLFLLGFERLATGRGGVWLALAVAAAGALTTWIHPWQGLTLLAIGVGAIAWGRLWSRLRVLAVPMVATAAPLAYYYALSHSHSSWKGVSGPNDYPHWGWWLATTMIPALAVAVPGVPWRDARLDLQGRILRLWPLAAAVVYFGLQRSWFYHAVVGLSLPLAILAVRGWQRVRAPLWVGAALALALVVPGCAFYVQKLREEAADHFLPGDEGRALAYLDRLPAPGGVLAREPLGTAVPAFTGRHTWVGHPTWTPAWQQRRAQADALFGGGMAPDAARGLVLSTGARFVVADCRARPDLAAVLGPVVGPPRRFGCAAVYRVRTGNRPPGAVL